MHHVERRASVFIAHQLVTTNGCGDPVKRKAKMELGPSAEILEFHQTSGPFPLPAGVTLLESRSESLEMATRGGGGKEKVYIFFSRKDFCSKCTSVRSLKFSFPARLTKSTSV